MTTTPKFVIEKGIPIPETAGVTIYPFAEFEVGDSIFIPNKTSSQIANATASHRKKGKKFKSVAFYIDENGEEQRGSSDNKELVWGCRVWRIE